MDTEEKPKVSRAEKRRVPCRKCGGPKEPGVGRKTCKACEFTPEEIAERRRQRLRGVCEDCGDPKRPGKGVKFCQECHELHEWKKNKKRAYREQRLCITCHKAPAAKHAQKCEACRNPVRYCQVCKIEPARGKFKKLCEGCYKQSLEDEKEYQRVYAQKHPRTTPKGKPLTAKQRKEKNELRRIEYRLKHDSKPLKMETYMRGNGREKYDPYMDTAPLLPVVEKWLAENGYMVNGVLYSAEYRLTRQANVSEKLIREMRAGLKPRLRMNKVDRLCHTMGTTIDLVYNMPMPEREIAQDGHLCA